MTPAHTPVTEPPVQALVLGIDVCKQRLDLAYSDNQIPEPLAYDEKGLDALLKMLRKRPVDLVVVEATGGIEQTLIHALLDHNFPVTLVEPSRVRAFARASAQHAKTDLLDARTLAEFGLRMKTRLLEKRSKNQIEIDALSSARSGLLGTLTQQKNRLRNLHSDHARQSIQKVVKTIEEELKVLDQRIRALIDSDDLFKDDDRLMKTIPGVGPGLTATILGSFRELGTLKRSHAASLLGVAPFNHDSGKYKGNRHIRGGRADVRKKFYMCALVAVRSNPVIRPFAERLRKAGKQWKVVLVACMRKLVGYLNTMLKHRLAWTELGVVKNCPTT